MKTIKTAVLLCAVLILSLTACMNGDSKALVGTWETEFDISSYLNAAIDGELGDHAHFFHTDDVVMVLNVTYFGDGRYLMSVDADKFEKECETLVPVYAESFKNTYEAVAAERGVPVEKLLEESGSTYEEMAEDFVASLDPVAMAEALRMAGSFKAEDGRLYRSNSTDEEISKDSYEMYLLTDDGRLKITGYTGEDADSNPFTYPMVFEKNR